MVGRSSAKDYAAAMQEVHDPFKKMARVPQPHYKKDIQKPSGPYGDTFVSAPKMGSEYEKLFTSRSYNYNDVKGTILNPVEKQIAFLQEKMPNLTELDHVGQAEWAHGKLQELYNASYQYPTRESWRKSKKAEIDTLGVQLAEKRKLLTEKENAKVGAPELKLRVAKLHEELEKLNSKEMIRQRRQSGEPLDYGQLDSLKEKLNFAKERMSNLRNRELNINQPLKEDFTNQVLNETQSMINTAEKHFESLSEENHYIR